MGQNHGAVQSGAGFRYTILAVFPQAPLFSKFGYTTCCGHAIEEGDR